MKYLKDLPIKTRFRYTRDSGATYVVMLHDFVDTDHTYYHDDDNSNCLHKALRTSRVYTEETRTIKEWV